MQWRDVTKVGIKPWMEITELTPYRILSETGTWRGVDGLLTLRFVKTQQGTRVTAEGRLIGHGPFALAAAVSGKWAPETIRKDLLRASEVLSSVGRVPNPDVDRCRMRWRPWEGRVLAGERRCSPVAQAKGLGRRRAARALLGRSSSLCSTSTS